MKNMKKFFAFLLAMAMVMGMAVSASAVTIKLTGTEAKPTSGHTYKVYQIFTGDLEGDKLTNIKYGSYWGEDENAPKYAGKLVPKSEIDEIKDARAYAKTLEIKDTTTVAGTLADPQYSMEATPGYYLIVDQGVAGDGDSLSEFIVKVVKDLDIAPKSEAVKSDKKEYDDEVELTNVNEANVGDVISYDATATIAANADKYDKYFFVLRDIMTSGLTYNNDVKVFWETVENGEKVRTPMDESCYKIYTGGDYTFEVAIVDATAHPGATVAIEYSATLNDSAVAMIPETNTFDVQYSNNPEHEYAGEEDSEKPGLPDSDKKVPTGETPDSVTKTYTTKLELTKENEQGEKLAGATFNLHSDDAEQTVVNTHDVYVLDNEAGEYYLLKNGTYTKVPPTETQYVKYGVGDENTEKGYILVDGKYVVPEKVEDYNGKDLYILITGSVGDYENTNKYRKETVTETKAVPAKVDQTFTTGTDGKITFDQLGAGTYTLTEVIAPDGYNYIEPITFTVKFVPNEDGTYTFVVDPAVDDITVASGLLSTTVVDKFGSTLPETGGMGTRLFYMIGGLLVVAAGVLLITKRRMATK